MIESVQRHFTKKLHGLAHLSYFDRLWVLNANTLKYPRLFADLVMTYKVVNQLNDIPCSSLFAFGGSFFNTRGHNRHCRISRSDSFCCRVVNAQNSLAQDVVNSASICVLNVQLNYVI